MKSKLLVLALAVIPALSIAQNRKNYDNGRNGNQSYNSNRNYNSGGPRFNYFCDFKPETGSALTVFSDNGERFFLMINGVKQNRFADSRIRIEGLPEITNDIQIIFDDNRTPSITKRINFMDPLEGRAVNLTLRLTRERNGVPRLAFYKLSSLERDYHAERGEYVMSFGNDHQPQQVTTNVVTPPPPPPAPMPMDMQSFNAAKQAIRGSSFDDTRLSTAKTIANSNYFTTDQVMEICKLFSFSDRKLEFAKYAYNRTVDVMNYYKVGAVFTFDSDKQALNDFINSRH